MRIASLSEKAILRQSMNIRLEVFPPFQVSFAGGDSPLEAARKANP